MQAIVINEKLGHEFEEVWDVKVKLEERAYRKVIIISKITLRDKDNYIL